MLKISRFHDVLLSSLWAEAMKDWQAEVYDKRFSSLTRIFQCTTNLILLEAVFLRRGGLKIPIEPSGIKS